MNQLPLLTIEQSIEIYKNLHAKNSSFGMDIFDKDFKVEDLIILENNGKGRSSPYSRCGFYIFILSLKGQSIRHINQHDYNIQAQSLQLLTPGVIQSFEDISQEQNSYVLLFNKSFFANNEIESLLEFHRLDLSAINLQGCEFERVKYLFEQIDYEYKSKQIEYKEISKSIITQILLILKRKKLSSLTNIPQNRAGQIMTQYLDLIEEHYQTKKTVLEYADILEVTAKHLGETVKEVSSKPALFYIHIRILKEIQYLLVYTKLSIKQISHILNFENASDLGRFFKRFEGVSPSKYRLSFQNP